MPAKASIPVEAPPQIGRPRCTRPSFRCRCSRFHSARFNSRPPLPRAPLHVPEAPGAQGGDGASCARHQRHPAYRPCPLLRCLGLADGLEMDRRRRGAASRPAGRASGDRGDSQGGAGHGSHGRVTPETRCAGKAMPETGGAASAGRSRSGCVLYVKLTCSITSSDCVWFRR